MDYPHPDDTKFDAIGSCITRNKAGRQNEW